GRGERHPERSSPDDREDREREPDRYAGEEVMTPSDLIEARDEVLRCVVARSGGLRLAGAGAVVHGVGVGAKVVAGRTCDAIAVRVYVPEKRAQRHIDRSDRVPRAIDGVPIDVVASPPAYVRSGAVASQQQPHDPLFAGISIGRTDP